MSGTAAALERYGIPTSAVKIIAASQRDAPSANWPLNAHGTSKPAEVVYNHNRREEKRVETNWKYKMSN